MRQRPHLLPSTLNNDNNTYSSDDDDQTVESVATDSRITYAIAMNNRLAQDGTSNSGSSNLVSEPSTVGEVEAPCMSTERYPRRARRAVDYREQLEPLEEDHFICKYYAMFMCEFLTRGRPIMRQKEKEGKRWCIFECVHLWCICGGCGHCQNKQNYKLYIHNSNK